MTFPTRAFFSVNDGYVLKYVSVNGVNRQPGETAICTNSTLLLMYVFGKAPTYNYSLTYDGNGGTVSANNGAIYKATSGTTTAASYKFQDASYTASRTGYTFKGRANTKANADAGVADVTFPIELKSNATSKTIYAAWTPKGYTLTVNHVDVEDGHAIVEPETETVYYDKSYTAQAKDLTGEGYEYDSDSGNTSGTVKGDVEVTYKYRKIVTGPETPEPNIDPENPDANNVAGIPLEFICETNDAHNVTWAYDVWTARNIHSITGVDLETGTGAGLALLVLKNKKREDIAE